MIQRNQLLSPPIPWSSIIIRMMIGGCIGLFLISIFVFTAADNADPEWGKYWMIRPLLITPIAAAMGAAFSATLEPLRREGGWKMLAAILISLVVFIISLWLGSVLGLAGTFWN